MKKKIILKEEKIYLKFKCLHRISFTLSCFQILQGPSWSWSYGSWIYNYLCNQCLSLL